MNFLLFLAPFFWGTQKREAAAPKASGCFMGGTCAVKEEPEKQKPRSCRAQELARSRAQENVRQEKSALLKVSEKRAKKGAPKLSDGRAARSDELGRPASQSGVKSVSTKR